MTHTASPVGAWDRASIVVLGAAGCALSYDALQQMAVAIHVRGLLTYLYPLVIDGFIAYGVRGLILTRSAPFLARLYVWTLFGSATAASIWANALHAIRLNQTDGPGTGLRLGDVTVGLLSTLAPLALAGAVHLYILITRHLRETAADGPERPTVRLDRQTSPRPSGSSGPTDRTPARSALARPDRRPSGARTTTADRTASAPETAALPSRRTGPQTDDAPSSADHSPATVRTGTADRPSPEPERTAPADRGSADRRSVDEDDLDAVLDLARTAVRHEGRINRVVVRAAVRTAGISLSNERMGLILQRLRSEEAAQGHAAPTTPEKP